MLKTSAPKRRNSSLAAKRESSVTSGEEVVFEAVVVVVGVTGVSGDSSKRLFKRERTSVSTKGNDES